MISTPLRAVLLATSVLCMATVFLPWARVRFSDPASNRSEQWWVQGLGETKQGGTLVVDPVGWRGILVGVVCLGAAAAALLCRRDQPLRLAVAAIVTGAMAVLLSVAYLKGVDFSSTTTDPISQAIGNKLRELISVNRHCIGPYAALILGLMLVLFGVALLRGTPKRETSPP